MTWKLFSYVFLRYWLKIYSHSSLTANGGFTDMVSQPMEKRQKQGGIFHDTETTQVHIHWLENTLDTLSPSLHPPH